MTQRLTESQDRRNFFKKLGVAGAAIGVAGIATSSAKAQSAYTDIDILNFALNLEYLEAEFYSYAVSGAGIDTLGVDFTGSGKSGATTGGKMVTFADDQVKRVAQELANDERDHVVLLRASIVAFGGTPIAKPSINLNALGIGFGSQTEFLTLSRVFEEIGVTAYGAGAPLIVDKTVLSYAARILAAEAEHVGCIRNIIDRLQIPTTALDGADILPPPTGSNFFSLNSQGLAELRDPFQVHFLAYGGTANATSGGFFPDGTNGFFTTAGPGPATGDGSMLTASPNPIPAPAGLYAATTITWNAMGASIIEVHVGAPDGPLFTHNVASGSMMTGVWVTDGMVFFLQDVSKGQALTQANTLATLTVRFQKAA